MTTAEVQESSAEIARLLEYMRGARGFDFTGYKLSSLLRRIRKRMAEVGVAGFAEYIDFLEVHPDEFVPLFNTVLINVTSFFRDPEAWQSMAEQIARSTCAPPATLPVRAGSRRLPGHRRRRHRRRSQSRRRGPLADLRARGARQTAQPLHRATGALPLSLAVPTHPERAAVIASQLLSFGRKQVLHSRVIAVNDVIAGLESMVRPLIGETIELTLDLDPRVGAIHFDLAQLEQLLMNLLVNARDAMPDGGRCQVSTEPSRWETWTPGRVSTCQPAPTSAWRSPTPGRG